jgi:hypothetical protein
MLRGRVWEELERVPSRIGEDRIGPGIVLDVGWPFALPQDLGKFFHDAPSIRTIGGQTQYFGTIANPKATGRGLALAVGFQSSSPSFARCCKSTDFRSLTLRIKLSIRTVNEVDVPGDSAAANSFRTFGNR